MYHLIKVLLLFFYWHYLFIMFPIPRIKVDCSINSVDSNGLRMMQVWIKYLENQRNGIDSFIEIQTKKKHCCFPTHRWDWSYFQQLGFKLSLLLILLIILASGWSSFGSNTWGERNRRRKNLSTSDLMPTWVFYMFPRN